MSSASPRRNTPRFQLKENDNNSRVLTAAYLPTKPVSVSVQRKNKNSFRVRDKCWRTLTRYCALTLTCGFAP